jgi:hypothetical protein
MLSQIACLSHENISIIVVKQNMQVTSINMTEGESNLQVLIFISLRIMFSECSVRTSSLAQAQTYFTMQILCACSSCLI